MLERYFVHGATIYTQTPDEYNNLRTTNSRSINCHFRDNNSLTNAANYEQEESDAMAWFDKGETINVGDVLVMDDSSQAYRIKQVILARRLGQTEVQFIKTTLERFDSFVS